MNLNIKGIKKSFKEGIKKYEQKKWYLVLKMNIGMAVLGLN